MESPQDDSQPAFLLKSMMKCQSLKMIGRITKPENTKYKAISTAKVQPWLCPFNEVVDEKKSPQKEK
jgi:hypothetical protein